MALVWSFLQLLCIWQSLVLCGSCLRSTVGGLFRVMSARYVVFSASWFDSGYMLLTVYGGLGVFTHFCVKVDLGS